MKVTKALSITFNDRKLLDYSSYCTSLTLSSVTLVFYVSENLHYVIVYLHGRQTTTVPLHIIGLKMYIKCWGLFMGDFGRFCMRETCASLTKSTIIPRAGKPAVGFTFV